MEKEMEDYIFNEYKKDSSEILKDNPIPNLLIHRIRAKNRDWNKKIESEKLPLIKDFFNKMLKEIILQTKNLSEEYYNAAKYL